MGTSRDLEYRWDNAYNHLGKDIEDFKPGDLKFANEEIILPILGFSNGVISIWELVNCHVYGCGVIMVEDKNILQHTIDFFGLVKYYGIQYRFGESFDNEVYLTVEKKDPNHIYNLKYNDVLNIKVYCPIKFSEKEKFRNEWFESIRNGR
jgi:hypothetical protein